MTDELEIHKATIVRLYLTEHKTLTEVMKTMRDIYHVHKKESQYKYKLQNVWKIKKKMPHGQARKIWRDVGKIVESRRLEGKSTELYTGHNRRSIFSMRRNIARYQSPPRIATCSFALPSTLATSTLQSFCSTRTDWRVETPPPATVATLAPMDAGIFQSLGQSHTSHPRSFSYRLLGTTLGRPSRKVINGLTPLLKEYLQFRDPTRMALQYQGDQAKQTEDILKVILVKLANKQHQNQDWRGDPDSDIISERMIIDMVQLMIQRDIRWAFELLSLDDPDMRAVREVVFVAAIGQRMATLIDPLVNAGVHPQMMIALWNGYINIPIIQDADTNILNDICPLGLRKGSRCLIGQGFAPALNFAAFWGDYHLCEVLIQSGADVNSTSNHGWWTTGKKSLSNFTPLSVAAMNPDFNSALEISKLLVSHEAEINTLYWPSALLISILMNNKQLTSWLIDHGADLTRLYYECASYRSLKKAGDLEFPDVGPFINEYLDIKMEDLPNNPCVVIDSDITALEVIILSGDVDLFHRARNIDLYRRELLGDDVLTVACLAGHIPIIVDILQLGANVNAESRFGLVPLAAASWDVSCQIAKICLGHGCLAERQMDQPLARVKMEPLHIAAWYHNTALIEILLDLRVDCNRLVFKPEAIHKFLAEQESRTQSVFKFLAEEERREAPVGSPHETYSALELSLVANVAQIPNMITSSDRNAPLQLLEAGVILKGGELVQASLLGQSKLVSRMLERGCDINEVWYDHTPLQAALKAGHLAAARLLINQGAKLVGGEFIQAILTRDPQMIDLLRFLGGGMHDTAYMKITWNYHTTRLATVNLPIAKPVTVLWAAAAVGNTEIAREYLFSGGSYDSESFYASVAAILGDNCYTYSQLHDDRIQPTIDGDISTEMGLVTLIARYRPSKYIDNTELEALCHVVENDHEGLVELFLDEKFIPHNECSTARDTWDGPKSDHPLVWAVASPKRSWILTRLLKRGYKPSHLAWGPMFRVWQDPIVSEELEPSHLPFCCQESLLNHAASAGNTEVLRCCIQAKISDNPAWNSPDDWPYTPLQGAAAGSHLECARILLAVGANANAPSSLYTALQHAALNGDVDMAVLLIQNGADVNAPASMNRYPEMSKTALELAAERGRIDMVRALFRHGIKVYGVRRVQLIRAVIYAQDKGHYALISLLKELGVWTKADEKKMGIMLSEPELVNHVGSTSWDFAEESDYGELENIRPGDKKMENWGRELTASEVQILKRRLSFARESSLAVGAEQTWVLDPNRNFDANPENDQVPSALEPFDPVCQPQSDGFIVPESWDCIDWSQTWFQDIPILEETSTLYESIQTGPTILPENPVQDPLSLWDPDILWSQQYGDMHNK